MALISLEHVTKTYDDKPVVNDLSPQVDQGELFVLVGTSGSGKTRSEERRVGKECSEPCRSRWSPYH